MNRLRALFLLLAACLFCLPLTSGCFSAISWQTADTVPEGGVEFGMGWSTTHLDSIKYTDAQGTVTQADENFEGTLPNPFPDLFMRFGLGEDLDIGFRLHFLGIHADVKIRLVDSEYFSLALAPGIGYSRPLIIFAEYAADLPLLMNFKLGEYVKIYLSAQGRISGWRLDLLGANTGADDIHTLGIGANLGFQFGTKRWFIRPEVAYMNYIVGFEDRCSEKLEFSWFTFGLGFGFVFGVEDDQQDDKIKKLEERLEQLEKEKKIPPADSGGSAPPEASGTEAVRERADEAAKDLEKEEDKRKND